MFMQAAAQVRLGREKELTYMLRIPVFVAWIRPSPLFPLPQEHNLGGCLIEGTLQFDVYVIVGGGWGGVSRAKIKRSALCQFAFSSQFFVCFLSSQDVARNDTAVEGEKVGDILRSLASVGLPSSEREDKNLGADVAAVVRMLVARNPPGHERVRHGKENRVCRRTKAR